MKKVSALNHCLKVVGLSSDEKLEGGTILYHIVEQNIHVFSGSNNAAFR